jgi:predicted nucleotidyltransferase
MGEKVQLPKDKLKDFCRRHHIKSLSVFGSFLRGENKPDSDIDILVEFDSDQIPGLIRLAGMEIELSELIGRKADLRTAQDLSPYFRQEVIATAEVQYAEG